MEKIKYYIFEINDDIGSFDTKEEAEKVLDSMIGSDVSLPHVRIIKGIERKFDNPKIKIKE